MMITMRAMMEASWPSAHPGRKGPPPFSIDPGPGVYSSQSPNSYTLHAMPSESGCWQDAHDKTAVHESNKENFKARLHRVEKKSRSCSSIMIIMMIQVEGGVQLCSLRGATYGRLPPPMPLTGRRHTGETLSPFACIRQSKSHHRRGASPDPEPKPRSL